MTEDKTRVIKLPVWVLSVLIPAIAYLLVSYFNSINADPFTGTEGDDLERQIQALTNLAQSNYALVNELQVTQAVQRQILVAINNDNARQDVRIDQNRQLIDELLQGN